MKHSAETLDDNCSIQPKQGTLFLFQPKRITSNPSNVCVLSRQPISLAKTLMTSWHLSEYQWVYFIYQAQRSLIKVPDTHTE